MSSCCGAAGRQRESTERTLETLREIGADAAAKIAGAGADACCPDPLPERSDPEVLDCPAAWAAPSTGPRVGDDCCSAKEQEIAALSAHADIKRVLQIVLAINFTMFLAEFTAGLLANSTALMADSVDMLGDALVYVLSLYALHRSLRWRAGAAVAKGAIIAAFGLWIAIEAALKLVEGVTPVAGMMGLFGLIALAANLTCLTLLYRHRHRDVNMSSTFECSRNDVIANVGVLLAAGGVYATGAAWPDILVGAIIAALFFRSAVRVLREAWPQFRAARADVAVSLE